MPTWTTSFSTPTTIAGLTATPDLDASAVDLAWTATALGALFWRYYIYRRDADTGILVRIGEVASESTPAFRDEEAPHGPVTYAVTVSNGWAESDPPTNVTTTLPLDWWIVDPNDSALVFPIPHVNDYSETWDPQDERFDPLDADAPVIVTGALLPPNGTVSARLLPAELATFGLLKRVTMSVPYVYLKDPFGDVYRVKLQKLRRSKDKAGARAISFDYTTVD